MATIDAGRAQRTSPQATAFGVADLFHDDGCLTDFKTPGVDTAKRND